MTNKTAKAIFEAVRKKDSVYWDKLGKKQALSIFQRAATEVPAYKDFLKKHKVDPSKISSHRDLQFVPPTDKDNYLRKYDLPSLTWGGHLDHPLVYTSTSGSTGRPVYFHRSFDLDWQSSIMHEFYYQSTRKIAGSTLVIVCFGMGVWIGGLITYQAFRLMKERGHNLSLITPGINKEEIFRALEILSPLYTQTILVGYPPFVKDVIDEAVERKIDLSGIKLRILCAAEPFSERFRQYLTDKISADPVSGVINIYGTADLGTMAIETSTAVEIRRLATKRPEVFKEIFGRINKMPTLAQYISNFIHFDTDKNQSILITGNNSLPLIRYAIGDHGGVFTSAELEKRLAKFDDIDIKFDQKLPFVYVYERIDMAATLYGLQIYPEPIREVLLNQPFASLFTGKFTLETKYNRNQDQYLYLNIELKKGGSFPGKTVVKALVEMIVTVLREKNSEYRELYRALALRATPRVLFWNYGDSKYFRPGIKQGWIKK